MPEPTLTPQAQAFLAKWGIDGKLIAGGRDIQVEFKADFLEALAAERERCANEYDDVELDLLDEIAVLKEALDETLSNFERDPATGKLTLTLEGPQYDELLRMAEGGTEWLLNMRADLRTVIGLLKECHPMTGDGCHVEQSITEIEARLEKEV